MIVEQFRDESMTGFNHGFHSLAGDALATPRSCGMSHESYESFL